MKKSRFISDFRMDAWLVAHLTANLWLAQAGLVTAFRNWFVPDTRVRINSLKPLSVRD